MDIAVIMPARNAATSISQQLEALASQTHPIFSLVVVDNGSTDETVSIVESYRSRIRTLRLLDAPSLLGPAHARNVGADLATEDLLLFCDSDDVVDPRWVANMYESLQEASFVAGRLEFDYLNTPFWRAQRAPFQVDGLQRLPGQPPSAATANLGIRRADFDRLGGFNETLVGLSDTEFCWRAANRGVELAWQPEAVVHYRFRQTLTGVFTQARDYSVSRLVLLGHVDGQDPPKRPWHREVLSGARLLLATPILVLRGRLTRAVWRWGSWWGRLTIGIHGDRRRGRRP